ncbi:MAG: methyltransferase domain-containing protein [Chloroflexi bacterium]|nr:methyltransferase domain-containing protein [Chloroflexota bacterium]MCI0580898.1 methyltransferase domain-containing protein [Chloroflexota bacterium]MCI0649746.1 methyltransferase domain-containing protein [Chloroflexota bacterium]MCI0725485.1 methyltransferase domain-containing protein [Chloroflexota bacterium]
MDDGHSTKAATRGEPGYVWRSGQERRLVMIQRWADLSGWLLDNGCGLGTYLAALAPFSRQRFGLEVELDRAIQALPRANGVVQGVGERLPFADHTLDFVLSNEVIEHVDDDRQTMAEMVRVTRPGGRIAIFCPNRWYPVEQHGIFWRGRYVFGNIPLVNYLPNFLRNRLAPHVRTYTTAELRRLCRGLPVRVVHHSRIFGGYDNIEYRWPRFGRLLKKALYTAEKTPLATLGISHFLVLEKRSDHL